MSLSTTFNYNNASNFTFDSNEIEFSGSIARLKRQTVAGAFGQTFTSDTGFTYDSTKAEFSAGLLQQKSQLVAADVLGATYNSATSLSWATFATLTATLNGSPTISGSKLVCTGNTNKGVSYTDADIGAVSEAGIIKFKYTPNYTTSPPNNVNIMGKRAPSGNTGRIMLSHSPSGTSTLRLWVNDSAGTAVHTAATIGALWSFTNGQEYTFELQWDTSSYGFRVYIDGALHGTLAMGGSGTVGTTATVLYVGADSIVYNLAEGSFNDVLLQGSTGVQDETYVLPLAEYIESKVDLPQDAVTIGSLVSYTGLTTTEVGAPRYIIDGNYWNGAAWVASDNSYAQANSKADVNTNIGAITPAATTFDISVVFTETNTQNTIDTSSMAYSQLGAYFGESTIKTNSSVSFTELVSLAESTTRPDDSDVRYHLESNSVLTYWSGSAWVVSDGTFTQSNTLADINANAATFPSKLPTKVVAVLKTSTDTDDTPEITSTTIEYDFYIAMVAVDLCTIYGYVYDNAVAVSGATISFRSRSMLNQDENFIQVDEVATSQSDGYFAIDLVRGNSVIIDVVIKFTDSQGRTARRDLAITVPDLTTQSLEDSIVV